MGYVSIGPAKIPEHGQCPWVVSYLIDDEGRVAHYGYADGPADRRSYVDMLLDAIATVDVEVSGEEPYGWDKVRAAVERLKLERRDRPEVRASVAPGAVFPVRVEIGGIDPATIDLPAGVTASDVSVASGAFRFDLAREAFEPAVPDDPRDLAHAALRILDDLLYRSRARDVLDVRIGVQGEWSLPPDSRSTR